MPTVLIVVYWFPPAGGPGVQRVLKFVKYLPQFGWQPVVLTATAETHPVQDPTLLRDVPPGNPVYRVDSPDVNRLRRGAERRGLGKAVTAANVALMLPDAALFWARKARSTAREIVQRHAPAVVLSSSPVGSAHLLGRWVHRSAGLPWVADFRDPWSQDKLYPYLPGYRGLNARMEKRVLADADRITTVSTTLHAMLTGLGNLPAAKVTIIENGYDEDDVRLLPPPRTSRFTITYTGEFSRIRKPDAFVAAIDLLVNRGDIPLEDLRVAFAGKQTGRFVPDRPPFEQLGYLSHDRLDALREQTDLLLLIQGDSPTAPAKLYEYLGSNRPTLSISEPGNVGSELVTRTRGGIATTHDAGEIAAAILPYYSAWKRGEWSYAPDWELIRSFSRRSLTGQLAGVLAEVAR